MRPIVVLDAPSNLGLRPRPDGGLPGCDKAPDALRQAGIFTGLQLADAGAVAAPRYVRAWSAGDGDRNAAGIADFSIQLADRLDGLLEEGFVVVLGGDCSILIGEALALKRRGRFGLAFLDGHGDFRHPGNDEVVAAAGEDLAIVTGRGDDRLSDLQGHGPSVLHQDVVAIGMRTDDVFIDEMAGLGMLTLPVERVRKLGTESVVRAALDRLEHPEIDGFWIHLDVDILDPSVMPAVDSPDPDGLLFAELRDLLVGLTRQPGAIGLDVCIYDPDLDPDGRYAAALATMLNAVLTSRS